MSDSLPTDPRLRELLADRALFRLSDAEARELAAAVREARLSEADEAGFSELDLAVGAAFLADVDESEQLPSHVRESLQALASRWVLTPREEESRPAPVVARAASLRVVRQSPAAGWFAAAAMLALAVLAWSVRPLGTVRQSPEAGRASLMASASDLVTLPWGDFNDLTTGAAPELPGVTGDVVWSESAQRGYLRLVGLKPNDPSREQYQLWIVDQRGLNQRVSGGVFDGSGAREVIVPIDPALRVNGAAVFAVTIEQPGGVVVSDMSRRVCLAAGKG